MVVKIYILYSGAASLLLDFKAMDELFEYSNYVQYLNDLAKDQKARGRTKADLAKRLGCQAAYLSQVLGGKVHLTEEHILRLCESLEFDEIKTEFLLLLLRLAKAGSPNLKKYLLNRREQLRRASEELEDHLPAEKRHATDEAGLYYTSSILASLIHVATSCEDFQIASSIAKRFSVDQKIVDQHLHQLEKFKMVEFREGRWIYSGTSLHFSKGSPLETQMQLARRLLALNQVSVRQETDLHYSVVFSSDQETFSKLRKLFLSAIEKMHKQVEPTPGEEVFAVCLDLFRA